MKRIGRPPLGKRALTPAEKMRRYRRKKAGLVLSATRSHNDKVFAEILHLHVKPGSVVADVTHGRGLFWRRVPPGTYDLKATDLLTGVDFRKLPYRLASIDALVLDPPYMSGGGSVHQYRPDFETRYRCNETAIATHAELIELYLAGCREAKRVLRRHGVLIVKCQDECRDGRQHLTHVELVNEITAMGFKVLDFFVVIRTGLPANRFETQRVARKNHSYFLVFKRNGD